MPKFLSGSSYSGARVPVCTYWSEDLTTDKEQDYAQIISGASGGSCIANAFFSRDQITCFNAGDCNGEGKCLPCSKYRYDGLRLGISHSPPLEILRSFDGGLTEDEVKSPNLSKFPPEVATASVQDQVPFHILIKNIQAKIAKCCRWSQGNGSPAEFYLAKIIEGPDTLTFTNASSQQETIKGIQITNSEFPDKVGTFFPIGTVVVAGFSDEPSFYIEPRTGLIKEGEGIIFSSESESPVSVRVKQKAVTATRITIDTTNALAQVCNAINDELTRLSDLRSVAEATNNLIQIDTLTEKGDALEERRNTACNGASSAQDDADTALGLIDQIVNESDLGTVRSLAGDLADSLNSLADKGDDVVGAGLGGSATRIAGNLIGILRQIARDIKQAGARSFSKCEFFYDDNNVAKQWNNPEDGTLPCNGVRTDCKFYTGEDWQYATEENLEIGKTITAEALQELRWRSEDWGNFPQPEEEFRRRFATPFIWAFKGYVEVSGEPDVEDMLLYRANLLFGRGDSDVSYETLEVEKVEVATFSSFSLEKSSHRIQPGSDSLDQEKVPNYPTLIDSLTAPTPNRLSITHPREEDGSGHFVYRSWDPDKNKLTLFGKATPEAVVYLVNETALRNRDRYHTFLGTKNFEPNVPTSLPGSPKFTGIESQSLIDVFTILENEKRQSDSSAPLGFDTISVDLTGFWRAIKSIDLVHGEVNQIFAFLFIDDTQFLYDSVLVDYRFLHALPIQTSFSGHDFSIQDSRSGSSITAITSDVTKSAEIKAETRQVVGVDRETLKFSHGYYGLRFRDRGLNNTGGLGADNDLLNDPLIAEAETPTATSTPLSSSEITSVGYNVVLYRKSDVEISDWYVVNDCGFIMIKIQEPTANRVLPLPSTEGTDTSLKNVLLDGGTVGSVVAQFGIEKATLRIDGEDKNLVQVYRNTDGDGLPANYVLLGPSIEAEEAFGRPDPSTDKITITYVYLQAQSSPSGTDELSPVNSDDVVEKNFHGDTQITRTHSIVFDTDGKLSVGESEKEGPGTGPIRDLTQEYVWVFSDEEGRPIGRKYSRLLVMYFGISVINIEIYYVWEGSCSTYGLLPDFSLVIGTGDGVVVSPPRGTTNSGELILGFRVASQIGSGKRCVYRPQCGDHEVLRAGRLREEFEVIETAEPTEEGGQGLKAVYVSAGDKATNEIVSVERAGSQFNTRFGPVWYPYADCDRPRYNAGSSIGPQGTKSTELINEQLSAAGFNVGVNVLSDEQVKSSGGTFGNLPPPHDEAYRGPDLVEGLVLDIHPSLRACSNSYTYGNRVLDGRIASFAGAARKRGQVDVAIYAEKQWSLPPFGNLGRDLLFIEISDRRGDYLDEDNDASFRWMPVFPERGNLAAGAAFFSEELESQLYRQLQTASPAGSINETVDESTRLSHKSLIRNQPMYGDYPFLGFYPVFLGDSLIGKEPQDRDDSSSGGISTMWAWREQEKSIGRAENDVLLTGFKFQSPDYFLDHRGLEVRLRPKEDTYVVAFTPPKYNQDTGALSTNGKIQLSNGPAREIVIDFEQKKLSLANQTNTVYDTSLELNSDPFPCAEGIAPDSSNFSATCTCQTDVSSGGVDNVNNLPSRLMHLDEVAPEGYFTLYESTTLQTPFTLPLLRNSIQQPCCQCVYYIRGIFALMDVEYLPSTPRIDPVRDSRLTGQYTWSRVPHGTEDSLGVDGAFDAVENLADNYTGFDNGDVFVTGVDENDRVLSFESHLAAFFPSPDYAQTQRQENNPIQVTRVPPDELKAGAIPTNEAGESFGENESITLAFRFDTYVRIDSLTINFFAGTGWGVPIVHLLAVDPENRGPSAPKPTLRIGRELAVSTSVLSGAAIPNPEFYDSDALSRGITDDTGVNFRVTLTPSYIDSAFWNRYAMEFLLVFESRGSGNSMGIAGIDMVTSAFLRDYVTRESIKVYERKYYRSTGSPAGGINPDVHLTGTDSASAYWRSTSQNPQSGGNKYRSYKWGQQVEDNQGFTDSTDPGSLERLQEDEYKKTVNSFANPTTFTFKGFIPKDERSAISFYKGTLPDWTNTMTLEMSTLTDVRIGGQEGADALFGEIPERSSWSAPGHAWTFTTEDAYDTCDQTSEAMVVNFNFAHLHDNLEVVETASFWEELPSGFTRILRSTFDNPDPLFGQGSQLTDGTDPGGTGQAQLLDASAFKDIPADVLEAAGFRRDEDGNLVAVVQGGE